MAIDWQSEFIDESLSFLEKCCETDEVPEEIRRRIKVKGESVSSETIQRYLRQLMRASNEPLSAEDMARIFSKDDLMRKRYEDELLEALANAYIDYEFEQRVRDGRLIKFQGDDGETYYTEP